VTNLTHYPYPSRRHVVLGRRGAVATSQPLAALAGMEMLLKGGSAVDAALAMAACLTVVEPTSNGIGGDLFAIVWDGELHGLNASGKSPLALTPERLPEGRMPERGLASRDCARGGFRLARPAPTLGAASFYGGPGPRHPPRRGGLPRGAGDGPGLAAGGRGLPSPAGPRVPGLPGGLLPPRPGPPGGGGVAEPPPRQDPKGDRGKLRGKPLPGRFGGGPGPLQRGHGGGFSPWRT
jgi:hypothetical protein